MKKQITIGQLITKLRKADRHTEVVFDFGDFIPSIIYSWRGSYDLPALGYDGVLTSVCNLIHQCEKALSNPVRGYKGGIFELYEHSPIWVANYSESGHTILSGVTITKSMVVLNTSYHDYGGR